MGDEALPRWRGRMERKFSKSDAKLIAETASDLADKALIWKARAIAAEEALRKFASEIYGRSAAEGVAHD